MCTGCVTGSYPVEIEGETSDRLTLEGERRVDAGAD